MQLTSRNSVRVPSTTGKRYSCRRHVVVRGSQRQEVDLQGSFAQLGAELDAVLQQVKKGGSAPSTSQNLKTVEIGTQDDKQVLFCDENGCVLLDKKSVVQGQAKQGSLNTLLTGNGWVLGLNATENEDDLASNAFLGRVGGAGWDVSLTQDEVDDFILALQSIRRTIREMVAKGMAPKGPDGKAVKVKWTTPTVRMEATCDEKSSGADHFSLTFNIGAGRAVRASWGVSIVEDVLLSLDAHATFAGPSK